MLFKSTFERLKIAQRFYILQVTQVLGSSVNNNKTLIYYLFIYLSLKSPTESQHKAEGFRFVCLLHTDSCSRQKTALILWDTSPGGSKHLGEMFQNTNKALEQERLWNAQGVSPCSDSPLHSPWHQLPPPSPPRPDASHSKAFSPNSYGLSLAFPRCLVIKAI